MNKNYLILAISSVALSVFQSSIIIDICSENKRLQRDNYHLNISINAHEEITETNEKLVNEVVHLYKSIEKLESEISTNMLGNGFFYSNMYRLIEETLTPIDKFNKEIAFILLYTMAIETNSGRLLYQLRGPARGIFQIEPNTEKWILSRNKSIIKSNLVSDLSYQIILAEAVYTTRGKDLPNIEDSYSVFKYYKKNWNTHKGATTIEIADKKTEKLYLWWDKFMCLEN